MILYTTLLRFCDVINYVIFKITDIQWQGGKQLSSTSTKNNSIWYIPNISNKYGIFSLSCFPIKENMKQGIILYHYKQNIHDKYIMKLAQN